VLRCEGNAAGEQRTHADSNYLLSTVMPWLHFFSVPESETSPNRGARVHPGRAPLLQAGEKGWVWVARRFSVHPPPRLPGGRSLFPDLVHSAARLKGRALPRSHEAIGTAICLSCVARSLLSALLSRSDFGRATLVSPRSITVARFRQTWAPQETSSQAVGPALRSLQS